MPGLFGTSEFFGLDVGSSAIRLVQLKNNGGRYSLVSFAETKIPIGLSQSDSPMDVKQVSQIIKKLVHDARFLLKMSFPRFPVPLFTMLL